MADRPNLLMRFFANPIVGVLGSIASLAGVVLAVIFYLEGQQSRELVYAVHPVRAVLARGDNPSGLRIEFMGEPIEAVDIIAMQLALWNQGRISIRASDLLSPIEVRFTPPVRILEVSVTKKTREVIEFDLVENRTLLQVGRIPLSWKILEQGDGANLQVIYAGSSAADPEIVGIIEGQARPRNLSTPLKLESPAEQYESARKRRTFDVIVSLVLVLAAWSTGAYIITDLRRHRVPRWSLAIAVVFFLLLGIGALVGFVRDYSEWRSPEPPFAF